MAEKTVNSLQLTIRDQPASEVISTPYQRAVLWSIWKLFCDQLKYSRK
jgi:hypothetical protein